MKRFLLTLLLCLWHPIAGAALTIEITQGAQGALPIAVVPFGGSAPEDIAAIVANDLKRSGRFAPLAQSSMLARPHAASEVDYRDWRALKQESLVVGQVSPSGGNYEIRFELLDVYKGTQIAGYRLTSSARDLRPTAHHIADLIYEALTGEKGAFGARIAYITGVRAADGKERVALQVADSDGFNPQTIFSSTDPVLSPAWAPDGQRIAYVSFRDKKPAIYIQHVYSGQVEKVADFPGINSAPAWSPDGRQLALALSKDGNPEIYVMDVGSRSLRHLHFGPRRGAPDLSDVRRGRRHAARDPRGPVQRACLLLARRQVHHDGDARLRRLPHRRSRGRNRRHANRQRRESGRVTEFRPQRRHDNLRRPGRRPWRTVCRVRGRPHAPAPGARRGRRARARLVALPETLEDRRK